MQSRDLAQSGCPLTENTSMAQQPLPPFTTRIDIKLALSTAFSTQFNSRGLEATYTPAWIATLRDACDFSNRLSVATEPYLSIPGGIINRFELSSRRQELLQMRQNLDATWEKKPVSNPRSLRQSTRIPLLSGARREKEEVDDFQLISLMLQENIKIDQIRRG